MTASELSAEIYARRSMLCVGLDTDFSRIPSFLKENCGGDAFTSVVAFNKAIIDATSPYCVAYKPNLAFYECMGREGWKALEETVAYIRDNHPGKFLIADAKRGDIGNTASKYAETFFKTFDFDAVTLSPYMGLDTVTPFLSYPGKVAIVVALSSNPSGLDFQEAAQDGKPLYRAVMEKCMEVSTPEQMMFVIGATRASRLREIRSFCPDNFFLVPGVGAQGGSDTEVIEAGANRHGGLLINSSRAVLYASSGEDFAFRAAEVAAKTARF